MAGTALLTPEPQEEKTQKTQEHDYYDALSPEEILARIQEIFREDERTDPKCQQRG